MHKPSDFYFYMLAMNPDDLMAGEESHIFLFISKKFWDAGEGLDCVPEPEYLFDKLAKMDGHESMENVFEFCDKDPHKVRQQLLDEGFVENQDLDKCHRDMCE